MTLPSILCGLAFMTPYACSTMAYVTSPKLLECLVFRSFIAMQSVSVTHIFQSATGYFEVQTFNEELLQFFGLFERFLIIYGSGRGKEFNSASSVVAVGRKKSLF